MTIRNIDIVTDDITGAEGADTYRFGWGGTTYEIDLAADNQALLRAQEIMAELIPHARRVKTNTKSAPVPITAGRRDIRSWWSTNRDRFPDQTYRDFGRIPTVVMHAWQEAMRGAA